MWFPIPGLWPEPEVKDINVDPVPIIVSGQGTSESRSTGTTPLRACLSLCVVANNVCGTSEETCRDIYVSQAQVEASTGPVCEGSDLYLYATGGVSYSWTGPGGFTSSSPNPVIYGATSANEGTYTVTSTNSQGCEITGQVEVTVNERPVVAGTVTHTACNQSQGAITLDVTGGSGSYDFFWSDGVTTKTAATCLREYIA
jgi:hypothetical protein